MINQLRLTNFKGWKDTGIIGISPVTVLFGSNSSGKSSIGQMLMLLKQSVMSSDRKNPLILGNEESAVNLGSPIDLVYKHDPNNVLHFSYKWTLNDKLRFRDQVTEIDYECDEIGFEVDIHITDTLAQRIVVNDFMYYLFFEGKQILSVGLHNKGTNNKRSFELIFDGYDFVRNTGRPWDISAPVRFYGFPDEVVAYYKNADFLQEINLRHERLFESIYYLGPLRKEAQRLYPWRGENPESVGYKGEKTIDAILSAREKGTKLNYKRKGKLRNFDVVIAEMLKKMNMVDSFEISAISDMRQEYDVKVKVGADGEYVNIPDVGFGVSQVLPVIVELFYAPAGSIIVMEQPEIHLHPSSQAALADVMICAMNSRENEKDRSVQLIIETHSEYFLRRLQRRIAEGEIAHDRISAYFADNTKRPAVLTPLTVNLFGEILNWPKDFFGNTAEDTFAQATAAMDRRMKELTNEVKQSQENQEDN